MQCRMLPSEVYHISIHPCSAPATSSPSYEKASATSSSRQTKRNNGSVLLPGMMFHTWTNPGCAHPAANISPFGENIVSTTFVLAGLEFINDHSSPAGAVQSLTWPL